ncbi:MAG: DUF6259 domain-containing protein [Fermentimonas sp.]|jgi:hypothetical protein
MKQLVILIMISVCFLSLSFQKLSAANERVELKTSEATLSVDKKGNLIITGNNEINIQINTSIFDLWKIELKNNLTGKQATLVPDKNIKWVKSGNEIMVVQNTFTVGNNVFPTKAEFKMSVKNDAFCFSGKIEMNEEWKIIELTYPDFDILKINDQNINILWPNSLGECFEDPITFGSRSFEYPGTSGSMAWFSVNAPKFGIYIGGHDPTMSSKKFYLSHSGSKSFETGITFPVYSNHFTIPDVMIKPYSGKWYKAARFYREWYDNNFKLAKVPQWMRENAGLMLNIFKQQNGSLMWRYTDIDELCDIAESLNLNLIGLWGWGIGGHDRLYPNYMPDNLMGGRQELEKAIDRAQKRGFKVICYSNGTIMDTSTDYYVYNGRETALLFENGRPYIDYYLKHKNTTPVILAKACPGSDLWRKTIMDLGLSAQSFGMDAFYIDQVGVRAPLLCFADHHDHDLPQEAYTKYRFEMMKEIRTKLQEKDTKFPIITEGTVDALLPCIDAFHGLGAGQRIMPNGFPELFRYTFPESIIIQLNSSPASKRSDVNFAAVYGLRHEIMCRYEPDVDYLKYKKIPTAEDYEKYFVNYPPDLGTMNSASPEEVTSYTHSVIQFENENSIFFRHGKFIDEDGIVVNGNDILAKGFLNGNKIGVVVWNMHLSESRNFSVSAPGYSLVKASEPLNPDVNATSPLNANSLRLLVFEKN